MTAGVHVQPIIVGAMPMHAICTKNHVQCMHHPVYISLALGWFFFVTVTKEELIARLKKKKKNTFSIVYVPYGH